MLRIGHPAALVDQFDAEDEIALLGFLVLSNALHGLAASLGALEGTTLEEIDRTAAAGARLLALDATAQRFDHADPRVLDVVTRAGDRGMLVLMEAGAVSSSAQVQSTGFPAAWTARTTRATSGWTSQSAPRKAKSQRFFAAPKPPSTEPSSREPPVWGAAANTRDAIESLAGGPERIAHVAPLLQGDRPRLHGHDPLDLVLGHAHAVGGPGGIESLTIVGHRERDRLGQDLPQDITPPGAQRLAQPEDGLLGPQLARQGVEQVVAELGPDLIGALADCRADDRRDPVAARAQCLHRRDCLAKHTQECAPPTRVGGADHAGVVAEPRARRGSPVRAGGRQLVVVAAGGHASMRTRRGDSVVAFALP